MKRHPFTEQERRAYPLRASAALAVSLLLVTAAVRLWPIATGEPSEQVFDDRGQELIQMEEVLQTRQQARRPPPPAPSVPVVVPDDIVLDTAEIELPDQLSADAGDADALATDAPVGDAGRAVRPASGPRPVRFVEPEYTNEAQKKDIRAEFVVEVRVDARGRVVEARVVERYRLNGNDPVERQAVTDVGYGLEESSLSAARQYVFRPAVQDGKNVESFTTLTFRFGV